MPNEILDTHKAFQPGSGYFGWMVIPDVQIVMGDRDMNQREKVIGAIDDYCVKLDAIGLKQKQLDLAVQQECDARVELIRVLHGVYGSRAAKGVVLRGQRYWVEFGNAAAGDQLHVDRADFEVLG